MAMRNLAGTLTPQQDYEAKHEFNLVKALRDLQREGDESQHGEVQTDLAELLDKRGIVGRTKQWAKWIVWFAGPTPSEEFLESLVMDRNDLYDPIKYIMSEGRLEPDKPLTTLEVQLVRDSLIAELNNTGNPPAAAVVQKFMGQQASAALVSGKEHIATRAQMRIANRPLASGDRPEETIRTWFANQSHSRDNSIFTQVDGSPLLLGFGPNGGHNSSQYGAFVGRKIADCSREDFAAKLAAKRKKMERALVLQGKDINSCAVYLTARNHEVASFLVDMLEMRVKAVVACGFVCAHEESNIKSLQDLKGPHGRGAHRANHIEELGHAMGRKPVCKPHPNYQKGAPRDFFNYFGADNGDDGFDWKTIATRLPGVKSRQLRLEDLLITSTLLEADNTLAPKDGSYKVAVYRLEIEWHEGFLWWGKHKCAELRVFHIQVADQAPAQLTRRQARMLYNTVAGCDSVDSVSLGFRGGGNVFVHCHAGLGRTGNIALGLSELLCEDVPGDPKEKLLWLRKFRPGAVQSPEQMVDGLQLSATIVDEVYERVKFFPLDVKQRHRAAVVQEMERNSPSKENLGSRPKSRMSHKKIRKTSFK